MRYFWVPMSNNEDDNISDRMNVALIRQKVADNDVVSITKDGNGHEVWVREPTTYKVPCNVCIGRGYIDAGIGSETSIEPTWIKQWCNDCNGTGYQQGE